MDTELRVVTSAQLRQITKDAASAGLELTLSESNLGRLKPSSYNVARVMQVVHGSAPYYRVMAVIELAGDTDWHEVVVDVVPADWNALPTVAEFDARLDELEAAARG